ncbi:hypothetical protein ACRAWD_24300 [Caulobacter segnis]
MERQKREERRRWRRSRRIPRRLRAVGLPGAEIVEIRKLLTP